MTQTIAKINGIIGDFVWGVPAMILIMVVGLLLTIRTRGLQIRRFGYSMRMTLGKVFSREQADKGAVTPFQAVCTALAATVGTGNIAGVAGAIAIGGPGAVFWMWVSAILLEQVGKWRGLGVGYGRLHTPAPGYRRQACPVHQPANPLSTDPPAVFAQLLLDLSRSIDPPVLVEDVLDLRREHAILYPALAALAVLVLVISLPPDAQQPARRADAYPARCFLYGRILYRGFFAKYAETFFRKSFSASSSRTRRLSC